MYKGNQNYYIIVTSSFIAHSCYKRAPPTVDTIT